MKIPLYAFAVSILFLAAGLFVGDLMTVDYHAAPVVNECRLVVGGICWATPSDPVGIFTFTEFLSVIALLAVVFTISDDRYKFRLAIAPVPLFVLTFRLTGFIGLGTLLTDVWIRERWLVPDSLISQAEWRAILGGMFFLVVMTWLYYAFIRPPIFSKHNYQRFAQALFRIIVRGNDAELPIIADELARSADALVALCRHSRQRSKEKQANESDYAYDVLLLIANKKLCRHLIHSASGTVIAFFNSMTSRKRYDVPLGAFSSNVSAEAIRDTDSLLYHEEQGFESGLIGYVKPFTLAIYGDYYLVEGLGGEQHRSPLDIHYEELWRWNAAQWEAYGRATLTTFKSFLEGGHWYEHSFTLYRAFGEFEHATMRGTPAERTNYYNSDAYARLRATVRFLEAAVDLIDEQKKVPKPFKVRNRERRFEDKYDHIAHLMLEIIFQAAALDLPEDISWGVCHNTVWNAFFGHGKQGKAWTIVQCKLRRLIFDEIVERKVGLTFKSARILGFCLYVLGLTTLSRKKSGIRRSESPLSRPLLAWTRKNYRHYVDERPDVAKAVLIGSLSYDAANKRLVKTYLKGLNKEVPKEYLALD